MPKGLTAVLVQPGKPLELETLDRYPLSKVVSHSFALSDVSRAFELAEWQGKNTGTAATRVILKP